MSKSNKTPDELVIEFMKRVALIAMKDQNVSKEDILHVINVGVDSLSWLDQPPNFKYKAVEKAMSSYFCEKGEQG